MARRILPRGNMGNIMRSIHLGSDSRKEVWKRLIETFALYV